MEKIKILFLEAHLSTGGAPNFALRRIQSLINNPEFELFVVEFSNISDEYVVQKNKIKSIIKPENFFTLDEDKNVLMDIIIDNKIDIVHSDEILEGFDVYGQIPNNILNRLYSDNRTWKIVETCHNVWFNPETSKIFNPDGYAFVTPWHKNVTFSKMPSYSEVIEYPIENNVPTEQEKKESQDLLGLDPNKKHVLNVGLWTKGKNQGEGIEIARYLEKTNPEIQFHFVGNQAPNFEEYWRPLMYNLPNNVKIWGERSDVDVFMKASDIFMFNSTWECNPIVLKESISHGLKILSRNLQQYGDIYTKYIKETDGWIKNDSFKLLQLLNSDIKYDVIDESKSFSYAYSNFYKNIIKLPKIDQVRNIIKPTISQNFIMNPFVEINGSGDNTDKFKVEFYDETGRCHYSNIVSINNWVRLNRQYYTKWRTKIWQNNDLIYDYTLDLNGKRVYISIESKSLGDTLAWFPYIREFKNKHNCEVIVSTFWNDLFKYTYPDIIFIQPSQIADNIYAMYKIGWFYNDEGSVDTRRLPINFRKQPMQKTACDILGLEFKETKPVLNIPNVNKVKKVGIATHSTSQCKYWNRENGWQEVVNYLTSIGYSVVNYSTEGNNYMGNMEPTGISKFRNYDESINNLIYDMSSCEFFIGIGSGLSWLAWSLNIPTILISGFSEEYTEPSNNIWRIINKKVCNGCFNNNKLDPGDWNWCPIYKNTERQYECSKEITSDMVISKINDIIAKPFIL